MPTFKPQDFIASPKDIYSTCQQPAANVQKMCKNNYLSSTFNDKWNCLSTIVNKPLANFLWGKHHLEKKNETNNNYYCIMDHNIQSIQCLLNATSKWPSNMNVSAETITWMK